MTKLVAVVAGEAFGAYVDLRPDSQTYGVVETITLHPGTQVLVPAGVGNGFQALADGTQYAYCFDAEWQPRDGRRRPATRSIPPSGSTGRCRSIPNDRAQLSAKDAAAPLFADLAGAST